MENNEKNKIEMRQEKNKELMIEQLKKTPIVEVACKKVGISRATFYRWKKNDEKFADIAEESLLQGKHLVNDMAESQLISAIKEGNMTAIIFWLKNNHRSYATRVELSGKIKTESEELTPEQEALVKKALELASFDALNNNLIQKYDREKNKKNESDK